LERFRQAAPLTEISTARPAATGILRPPTLGRLGGRPTVLIVENEALVRMSAVHMVEDAGCSALEARNADEAIRLLESRDDIAVVFTGIAMSGSMDGMKLAHAIRGGWPPIHLIVTSCRDLRHKLPANCRFIPKPYCTQHVAAVLQELLSADPRPVDC
jgi:two-component system, response regulator PdtaR